MTQKEQLAEIHGKLDTISDSVSKLVFTITSDEDTKRIGMAEQTQINTKDISEMKTETKVRLGKVGVVVSIISLVLGIVGGFLGKHLMK